jgi:hypothetical protein
MPQYLLSIYQPDGAPPPPEVLGPIMERIGAWNAAAKAAGVWVFTGPLHPPSTATVLRVKGDEILMTDGPYLEGKEHIGGFEIIQVPDLDAALEWAGRLAGAIGLLPIEVRPLREAEG